MDIIQMRYGLPELNPPFLVYTSKRTEDGRIYWYEYLRQPFIHQQNFADVFEMQEWAIDEWYNTHFDAMDGDVVLAGLTAETTTFTC